MVLLALRTSKIHISYVMFSTMSGLVILRVSKSVGCKDVGVVRRKEVESGTGEGEKNVRKREGAATVVRGRSGEGEKVRGSGKAW